MSFTKPPDDRSCGECQACCEVLPVVPTNDPGEGPVLTRYFERCQWQCSNGCAIYDSRPSPCAAYHCMWRLGWGLDDARPDRVGFLAEGTPVGWAFLVETRPGGVLEELAQQYIAGLWLAPESPATAIHVFPWGSETNDCGYWIGAAPECSKEDLEALLALVTASGGAQ